MIVGALAGLSNYRTTGGWSEECEYALREYNCSFTMATLYGYFVCDSDIEPCSSQIDSDVLAACPPIVEGSYQWEFILYIAGPMMLIGLVILYCMACKRQQAGVDRKNAQEAIMLLGPEERQAARMNAFQQPRATELTIARSSNTMLRIMTEQSGPSAFRTLNNPEKPASQEAESSDSAL